jgi:hypothetical protein
LNGNPHALGLEAAQPVRAGLLSLALRLRRAMRLDPWIQAVLADTQALGDFGNVVSAFQHLLDGFELEIRGWFCRFMAPPIGPQVEAREVLTKGGAIQSA